MQDAMNNFHGTPEEIRITISNADLALARQDVEGLYMFPQYFYVVCYRCIIIFITL